MYAVPVVFGVDPRVPYIDGITGSAKRSRKLRPPSSDRPAGAGKAVSCTIGNRLPAAIIGLTGGKVRRSGVRG
jgi:hypothetical protein